jgi:hypothetical protein
MRTTQRLRTPTWQLLISLLLFCGCTGIPTDGSGADPGADEALASEGSALSLTSRIGTDRRIGRIDATATSASWDAPSCSSDALDSHPPLCQGPWKYTRTLTAVGRDPFCVARECVVHGSCSMWKNGPAANVDSSSFQSGSAVTVTCRETCSTDPRSESCTGGCSPAAPSASACAASAAARYNTLLGQLNASITSEGGVGSATRSAIIAKLRVTGTIAGVHISTTYTHNAKFYTTVDKDKYWCQISTDYPIPQYAQSPSCPCAQTDYVSCEHPTGSVTEYSLPGAAQPTGTWISSQQCTTCDTVGYTGGGAAGRKYQCLSDALSGPVPSTTTQAVFRRAIIARLELLFEFAASSLTQAQRDTILALYASGTSYPVCEAPVPISDGCRTVSDAAGMTGLLQSCQALAADHVPTSSVDAQLPACLTLYDKLVDVPGGACRDELVALTSTTVEGLIEHRFDAIAFGTLGWAGLTEALNTIDSWYDHAKMLRDPALLDKRVSVLLGRFWEHTYAAAAPAPQTVSATDVQQQLASMLETGLAADWAVLSAAFSDESQLDSPPLLAVVADALRSTTDRLETVSEMHDAACRYKGCSDNVDSTLTSQTWRVLAGVLDVVDLQPALTTGLALKTAHLPLWNALDRLRNHRARLQAAFTAAGGGDLSEMFGGFVPDGAEALAALLGSAREHWIRYGNFGLFLSAGERPLYAGMQNKGLVTSGITGHENALGQAINNYAATKVNVVNALLAQMRGEQEMASIKDRLLASSRRIVDIIRDTTGLQAREEEETRRYADYEKAFDDMHDAGVFDDDMASQSDVIGGAMLSGADARFTVGAALDASSMAALRLGQPWREPLTKGQALHLNVTGSWAPTCALQRSNIPGPTPGTYDNLASDAVTGPEGYMMQWSNGDFSAATWTHDSVTKESLSAEICLQIEVGAPGFVKFVLGSSAEIIAKACAGLSHEWSQGNSTSNGNDERSGASFSAGIHLDETPFPAAPAGALLLVVTEQNNPRNILDVQVVSRQMVYLAAENSDAYLVVNDVNAGGCTTRPGDKLTIEGQKVTSFGAIAQQLKLAMADTLLDIRADEPAILEQGALMPSDQLLIRQHARQTLSLHLGFDLTELPAAVMEFYDTWLTAEVTSLERRAAIRGLQRDLDRSFLEVESMNRELGAAGDQSRLLALVPRWSLRNLQAQRVDAEASAELRLITDYVPPVLELRYSKALTILRTKPNNKVTPLMNVDFAAPMEVAYAALDALALDIRDTLEFAVLDSADYGTAMAALAFPNPNMYGQGGAGPAGCEFFGTCNLETIQPTMLWQTVEMERAQQVWDGVLQHGWSSFAITPDDLYNIHGGNARLHCSDGAPVVKKVALYIVGGQTEYDSAFYRPPMRASAEQIFPVAGGKQTYAKVDTDWLSMGLPVFGGAEGQAVQRVHADNSHVGEGLSPFGHWDVDFTTFPFATDTISALVMVFELEPRPLAAPGVGIEACMLP